MEVGPLVGLPPLDALSIPVTELASQTETTASTSKPNYRNGIWLADRRRGKRGSRGDTVGRGDDEDSAGRKLPKTKSVSSSLPPQSALFDMALLISEMILRTPDLLACRLPPPSYTHAVSDPPPEYSDCPTPAVTKCAVPDSAPPRPARTKRTESPLIPEHVDIIVDFDHSSTVRQHTKVRKKGGKKGAQDHGTNGDNGGNKGAEEAPDRGDSGNNGRESGGGGGGGGGNGGNNGGDDGGDDDDWNRWAVRSNKNKKKKKDQEKEEKRRREEEEEKKRQEEERYRKQEEENKLREEEEKEPVEEAATATIENMLDWADDANGANADNDWVSSKSKKTREKAKPTPAPASDPSANAFQDIKLADDPPQLNLGFDAPGTGAAGVGFAFSVWGRDWATGGIANSDARNLKIEAGGDKDGNPSLIARTRGKKDITTELDLPDVANADLGNGNGDLKDEEDSRAAPHARHKHEMTKKKGSLKELLKDSEPVIDHMEQRVDGWGVRAAKENKKSRNGAGVGELTAELEKSGFDPDPTDDFWRELPKKDKKKGKTPREPPRNSDLFADSEPKQADNVDIQSPFVTEDKKKSKGDVDEEINEGSDPVPQPGLEPEASIRIDQGDGGYVDCTLGSKKEKKKKGKNAVEERTKVNPLLQPDPESKINKDTGHDGGAWGVWSVSSTKDKKGKNKNVFDVGAKEPDQLSQTEPEPQPETIKSAEPDNKDSDDWDLAIVAKKDKRKKCKLGMEDTKQSSLIPLEQRPELKTVTNTEQENTSDDWGFVLKKGRKGKGKKMEATKQQNTLPQRVPNLVDVENADQDHGVSDDQNIFPEGDTKSEGIGEKKPQDSLLQQAPESQLEYVENTDQDNAASGVRSFFSKDKEKGKSMEGKKQQDSPPQQVSEPQVEYVGNSDQDNTISDVWSISLRRGKKTEGMEERKQDPQPQQTLGSRIERVEKADQDNAVADDWEISSKKDKKGKAKSVEEKKRPQQIPESQVEHIGKADQDNAASSGWDTSSKDKKKGKNVETKQHGLLSQRVFEPQSERVGNVDEDNAVTDDLGIISEKGKREKDKDAMERVRQQDPLLRRVPDAPRLETVGDADQDNTWDSWNNASKNGKKKGKNVKEVKQQALLSQRALELQSVPVENIDVNDRAATSGKDKEGKDVEEVKQQDPLLQTAPDDPHTGTVENLDRSNSCNGWATTPKKGKKKRGENVQEIKQQDLLSQGVVDEPQPKTIEIADQDNDRNITLKKDKKKSKNAIGEPRSVVEEPPAASISTLRPPPLEPESVKSSWGTSIFKTEKKKQKGLLKTEEIANTFHSSAEKSKLDDNLFMLKVLEDKKEAQSVTNVANGCEWGSAVSGKQKDRKKSLVVEDTASVLKALAVTETAVESAAFVTGNEWSDASFITNKTDKKTRKGATVKGLIEEPLPLPASKEALEPASEPRLKWESILDSQAEIEKPIKRDFTDVWEPPKQDKITESSVVTPPAEPATTEEDSWGSWTITKKKDKKSGKTKARELGRETKSALEPEQLAFKLKTAFEPELTTVEPEPEVVALDEGQKNGFRDGWSQLSPKEKRKKEREAKKKGIPVPGQEVAINALAVVEPVTKEMLPPPPPPAPTPPIRGVTLDPEPVRDVGIALEENPWTSFAIKSTKGTKKSPLSKTKGKDTPFASSDGEHTTKEAPITEETPVKIKPGAWASLGTTTSNISKEMIRNDNKQREENKMTKPERAPVADDLLVDLSGNTKTAPPVPRVPAASAAPPLATSKPKTPAKLSVAERIRALEEQKREKAKVQTKEKAREVSRVNEPAPEKGSEKDDKAPALELQLEHDKQRTTVFPTVLPASFAPPDPAAEPPQEEPFAPETTLDLWSDKSSDEVSIPKSLSIEETKPREFIPGGFPEPVEDEDVELPDYPVLLTPSNNSVAADLPAPFPPSFYPILPPSAVPKAPPGIFASFEPLDIIDTPDPVPSPEPAPVPQSKESSISKIPSVVSMENPPAAPEPPTTALDADTAAATKTAKKERAKIERTVGASWAFWAVTPPRRPIKKDIKAKEDGDVPKQLGSPRPALVRSKSAAASRPRPRPKEPENEGEKTTASDKEKTPEIKSPRTPRNMGLSNFFLMAPPPPTRTKSARRTAGSTSRPVSRRPSIDVDNTGLPTPPPDTNPEIPDKAARVLGAKPPRPKRATAVPRKRRPGVPKTRAMVNGNGDIINRGIARAKEQPTPKYGGPQDDIVMVDQELTPGPEVASGPDDIAIVDPSSRDLRPRKSNAVPKRPEAGGLMGLFGLSRKPTRPEYSEHRRPRSYRDDDARQITETERERQIKREEKRRRSVRIEAEGDGFTTDPGIAGGASMGVEEAEARKAERRAKREARRVAEEQAREAELREAELREAEERRARREKARVAREKRAREEEEKEERRREEKRTRRAAAREERRAREEQETREAEAQAEVRERREGRRVREMEANSVPRHPSKSDRRRSYGAERNNDRHLQGEHATPRRHHRSHRSGDEPSRSRRRKSVAHDSTNVPHFATAGKDKASSWVNSQATDPPEMPPIEPTVVDLPAGVEAANAHSLSSDEEARRRMRRQARRQAKYPGLTDDEIETLRTRRREARRAERDGVKSSSGSGDHDRDRGRGYDSRFISRQANSGSKRTSWFKKIANL